MASASLLACFVTLPVSLMSREISSISCVCVIAELLSACEMFVFSVSMSCFSWPTSAFSGFTPSSFSRFSRSSRIFCARSLNCAEPCARVVW